MKLEGQKVLVFGTGVSGIAAANLLENIGASVLLYDGNAGIDQEALKKKLKEGSQARIVAGEMTDDIVRWPSLAVLSPGVPVDAPDVCRLKERGIPIWGEVELAFQTSAGKVLAITGTNGKTTTTALLGAILEQHCRKGTEPLVDQAFTLGNIGTPYTEAALQMTADSAVALEVSSFQLETIHGFHPVVSAITNITPDHLNRHHTMEEYVRVKERICENQTADEVCVLNYEDERLRLFGEKVHVRAVFFSSAHVLDEGYCLEDGWIVKRHQGDSQKLLEFDKLFLPGLHNAENVMTAVAMADAFGIPMEEICEVCRTFHAVEHRIEFVAEKNHVAYYNDSKGTNPDAAIKAVQAMSRPTVLLGGGYDKGSTYGEWIDTFAGKVHTLVLTGATREKIAAEARSRGFDSILMADTFEEAFALCVKAARPGDAVLLSPACASWGMFPNYEVRGKVFKDLVRALPDGLDGEQK